MSNNNRGNSLYNFITQPFKSIQEAFEILLIHLKTLNNDHQAAIFIPDSIAGQQKRLEDFNALINYCSLINSIKELQFLNQLLEEKNKALEEQNNKLEEEYEFLMNLMLSNIAQFNQLSPDFLNNYIKLIEDIQKELHKFINILTEQMESIGAQLLKNDAKITLLKNTLKKQEENYIQEIQHVLHEWQGNLQKTSIQISLPPTTPSMETRIIKLAYDHNIDRLALENAVKVSIHSRKPIDVKQVFMQAKINHMQALLHNFANQPSSPEIRSHTEAQIEQQVSNILESNINAALSIINAHSSKWDSLNKLNMDLSEEIRKKDSLERTQSEINAAITQTQQQLSQLDTLKNFCQYAHTSATPAEAENFAEQTRRALGYISSAASASTNSSADVNPAATSQPPTPTEATPPSFRRNSG